MLISPVKTFLFIMAIIVLCQSTGICSSHIRIVDNNEPMAVIVIADDASQQVQLSAKLLVEYVKKSTKTELQILNCSQLQEKTNKVKIRIGTGDYLDKHKLNLDNLDEDGFVISFPDENNIIIAGPTDWGTEFGVYEFLERYAGVRWLMPGTDGEHAPEHSTLNIPVKEVRQEPVFFSRNISGLRGEAQIAWARRNRMHGRVKFHHNLLHLFPPDQYTKSHPEFFPVHKGNRYLPPTNNTHRWQPCFSAPDIVNEAIKNICSYFSEHPEATSYSLGVNDSGGHCECEKCMIKNSGKKNFIGYRDVSDLYFEWANAVVEGVLEKFPDKWFGCLAYREIAQPPSRIKVHQRIIPYMTYDRMKWIDKDVEAEGKRVTQWWAEEAPSFGWYDYIYGTPYLLPRVYFHKMADYYRYGHAHGVRAMYAEAYPNWGEGPKLYVALKLQWNPDLDVDVLLKDWYVSAVGEEAASDLAAYYGIWEEFWTKRILSSKWFTEEGQYLYFNSKPMYLDLVTYEDISKSRKLLESVLAKAKTPKQRARAEIFLKAFEYYEASAVSYLGLVKQIKLPDKDRKYYEDMYKRRFELVNEFEKDPVLVHPVRFDKRGILEY
ncbi:MAG: DUF4838 domain-containing protein [wastewater metagenome]|nr:DUF4838 domain-containing protein [Candidatus Loosdrechtia aerotolerans]